MNRIRLHLIAAAAAALLAAPDAPAQTLQAGVFRQGSGGHALEKGLTWSQFDARWRQLSPTLRLVDVETYVEGGSRRYAGVWRAGTDAHALIPATEWTAFRSKWNELSGQNLRLRDIETYEEGGRRRFIGVYRAGTGGHALEVGLAWGAFEARWRELAAQNLRLVDVETYLEGGQRRWIGVWEAGSDGHVLEARLAWNAFEARVAELGRRNLRLVDMEVWEEGGRQRYAGVWRAGSDGHALWAGVDWENFSSKWDELSGTLRLDDLEVWPTSCPACNQVVMPSGSYDYRITGGALHCDGRPGTCGPNGGGGVTYRSPIRGANRYARLTALYHDDRFLRLPFRDPQVKRAGIWRYSHGGYHHAGDYHRDDWGTFRILASAPGRVIHVGWDDWSGNTVVVSHDVDGVQDAFRTIYMHLRNGPANDCALAWSQSVPSISGTSLTEYRQHLNDSGCPREASRRTPSAADWGTDAQRLDSNLLGRTVAAGDPIAWAGNTGPGGKRGGGGPNTHLHIFWVRRDPTDNRWYFIDPYGVYAMPNLYPAGITDRLNRASRYPSAWLGDRPQHP
jgi:hypothetical protein